MQVSTLPLNKPMCIYLPTRRNDTVRNDASVIAAVAKLHSRLLNSEDVHFYICVASANAPYYEFSEIVPKLIAATKRCTLTLLGCSGQPTDSFSFFRFLAPEVLQHVSHLEILNVRISDLAVEQILSPLHKLKYVSSTGYVSFPPDKQLQLWSAAMRFVSFLVPVTVTPATVSAMASAYTQAKADGTLNLKQAAVYTHSDDDAAVALSAVRQTNIEVLHVRTLAISNEELGSKSEAEIVAMRNAKQKDNELLIFGTAVFPRRPF
jgi:hypothetical protein